MSVAFLPQPLLGTRGSWGTEESVPVRIIGYADEDGEWLVINETGELGWVVSSLIRFDPVPA